MKESQHIYVQLEMQFIQNVRPKCEFPAYCEALHAEASNGAEYRLEKIIFFFFSTRGFYCQKAVNHFV